MYTATLVHRPVSGPRPLHAAVGVIAFALGGTGSIYAFSQANAWGPVLDARIPNFSVRTLGVSTARPDIRSAAEHIANIRQVLNPAIADLVSVFGVSRQAIYKWISGESTPEDNKLERIRSLSLAADAFQKAQVMRASSLLKMKAFDGQSLLDLVSVGNLADSHIQALISEAQVMDAAYSRSGLGKSKARPSDDWRTELSIPGSSEG
ncbi:XRE family transcriptional regulator [Asaia spathodeae]|uniref:XRE family transcriptional regulator n=1 Tax=Asaia spathodeae TaxID=657016 RepID=A0ABX2P793_9PROT